MSRAAQSRHQLGRHFRRRVRLCLPLRPDHVPSSSAAQIAYARPSSLLLALFQPHALFSTSQSWAAQPNPSPSPHIGEQQMPIPVAGSRIQSDIMATHQAPHDGSGRSRKHDARGMPRGLFWTIVGSVVGLPPLTYFYWDYRKQHMDAKREALIRQAMAARGQ